MKITFKKVDNKYLVTVNGTIYLFDTCKAALNFIFNLRNVA